MTALPVETGRLDAADTQQRLDRLRLRLVDAAADLRLVPSVDDMLERLHAVAEELASIVRELPLVIHLSHIDDEIAKRASEIDQKLATGWVPDARSVEDVLAGLREALRETPSAVS